MELPAVPFEVGFVNTQTAMEVYADSLYAYVADGSEGLKIVDVLDPYNPSEVGSYNTGGLALAVYVKDAYAYHEDGEDGLYIIKNDLITSIDDSKIITIPENFLLFQNYPNPFNPTTQIKFSLAEDAKVMLKIYNVMGQEVKTLLNEGIEAGIYNINFDASELSSGVYFYSIKAIGVDGNNFIETKKMMVLK